ncbi:MAG: hypothetical protein FJ033_06725 [Chloroflexi bacterium]|nr:hypothetical protein [Chloroflexota bacterium]
MSGDGAEALVGIVPAAGRAQRVLGLRWPKYLYPVGWEETHLGGTTVRRPRVVGARVMDGMIDAGVRGIYLIVNEANDPMRYFGAERRGTPIAYLCQSEPRGGAYAIDLARPWLPARHTVLFGFPDTIVEPASAFADLLGTHRATGADLSLGVFPTDHPETLSPVAIDGDRAVAIYDKPTHTSLRNTWGIACWGPSVTALQKVVIEGAPGGSELVPADLFVAAIQCGLNVRAHLFAQGGYFDVGTPRSLSEALDRFGTTIFRADPSENTES